MDATNGAEMSNCPNCLESPIDCTCIDEDETPETAEDAADREAWLDHTMILEGQGGPRNRAVRAAFLRGIDWQKKEAARVPKIIPPLKY